MWIKSDTRNLHLQRETGLTIGAFDGVHRGHQALIDTLVEEARARDLSPLILTFDPPPRQVFKRGEDGLLTTLDERLALFEPLGVDGVIVLPFDDTLIETPAEAFVHRLVRDLGLRGLWIGSDFSLGKGGTGSAPRLRAMGRRLGFRVRVLEKTVQWDGRPVSSSRIRRAIRAGAIEEANGCLGHPYHITEIVRHGDRRGRELGFPTANLRVAPERILPANGVYVCEAHLEKSTYLAVTNVGTRPTFNGNPPLVEAHLLDFQGNLYDRQLRVDFLTRLRAEKRFPSAEALIEQMQQDRSRARAWWERERVESLNT